MVYTIDMIEDLSIAIPLVDEAFWLAQRFSSQHSDLQRAEQIRLNTLAVWAVNDYMQLQGYTTDLMSGDSWNIGMRLVNDVADLKTESGCLECRPIRGNERTCVIPPEVWHDRIGYVMVRIDEAESTATLLGYLPPFEPEQAVKEVSLGELRSMDDFIDHLSAVKVSVEAAQESQSVLVNLSQCLQRNFSSAIAAGFELFQEVFAPPQVALGYRGRSFPQGEVKEYTRLDDAQIQLEGGSQNASAIATLLELARETDDEEVFWRSYEVLASYASNALQHLPGVTRFVSTMRLDGFSLKLFVFLVSRKDREMSVFLRVCPLNDQDNLPQGLKLILLDEAGEVFDEVPDDDTEVYRLLQYKVIYEFGERFSVKLAWGTHSLVKSFVA
jgi:hypothetical protein